MSNFQLLFCLNILSHQSQFSSFDNEQKECTQLMSSKIFHDLTLFVFKTISELLKFLFIFVVFVVISLNRIIIKINKRSLTSIRKSIELYST